VRRHECLRPEEKEWLRPEENECLCPEEDKCLRPEDDNRNLKAFELSDVSNLLTYRNLKRHLLVFREQSVLFRSTI
jgi:hypothetical protein